MATANLGRVGFVNKGTYSGATAYKVNDVVVYNSGTYTCIQANTGQAPTNTSYWQNWVADNAVHKTGDETIAGIKTFSNNTVLNGTCSIGFNGQSSNRLFIAENGVSTDCVIEIRGTNSTSSVSNGVRLKALGSSINNSDGSLSIETRRNDLVYYEALRIDSNGSVLLKSGSGGLGYGTGAGGTVTQLTSKSIAVTLNKPTGQITMHNAALAAGASISFIVNNTTVVAAGGTVDNIVVSILSGVSGYSNYRIQSTTINGGFVITLTNQTGTSLSEAVVLKFDVIKGAIV